MNKKLFSILIFLTISVIIYLIFKDYLTLNYLKSTLDHYQKLYQGSPLTFTLKYILLYIVITTFSVPGATALSLAGGAIFGLPLGFLIISFSSSIGATFAFLASRFLLRGILRQYFKTQIDLINSKFLKNGIAYLLVLRLVPIFPFFLVNLAMGLTKIKIIIYYIVSQIGMLIGTFIYVNAGSEIAKINHLSDIHLWRNWPKTRY